MADLRHSWSGYPRQVTFERCKECLGNWVGRATAGVRGGASAVQV